jgi:hypothetical protein
MHAATLTLVLVACGLEPAPAPCRNEIPPIDEMGRSHHDPELERRIPDTVGGAPLTVASACANVSNPGGLTVAPAFLAEVGVDLADVSHAERVPEIGDDIDAQVSAWRYHSATAADIRTAILSQLAAAGESMRETDVGGRSVHVSDGPLMNGTVIHVAGDAMYLLSGSDAQVAELLAGLP